MNPDLKQTLARATDWLLSTQKPEGYWAGMVESNSCIEAQWLLCSHILKVDLPIKAGVMRALFNRQRPDGSWDIYPHAPAGDINSTVEVYAALRAMGEPAERPELARARAWIHAHGGLTDVRVFTRYWLALIGIWPWRDIPNLPPEIIRFPLWFPFNIYNFAQWARATMVPLAVLCARRPVYPLPEAGRLEELFPEGIANFDFSIPVKKSKPWSLEALFEWIDKGLHGAQTLRLIPFRENAIKLCLEWMIRHQDADGAWGGIQPPWIYGLMALRGEGYAIDHPVMARGLAALSEHWSYERDGGTHIQASESPVWDTLFCLLAMAEAGHRLETPALRRALIYILDHQILEPGDWSLTVKGVAPGGWAFERANVRYPDVDDTALALLVLAKLRSASEDLRPRVDLAIDRALAWVWGMQSANGGWAAFDRDNDKAIISKIPFCNFGEALDPPSVDVTAHVLEALGELGLRGDHPKVARALAFVYAEQEPEGSWFGRWGVNHIYGIGAVLPGLLAIGEDMKAPRVQKAAAWLVGKQNADGGWGESCASYMDADWIGRGESTPAQTAWALMALMAAGGDSYAAAIARGFDHLAATQRADGTWDEAHYTATGFPGYGVGARIDLRDPLLKEKLGQGAELSRGFMISFNMYRHYFPMLALARRIAE